MKKMKQNFKLFLIQFLFWMFLTLDFNPLNLIMGIVFSLIVTKASYGVLYDDNGYKYTFPGILTLIKYILKLIVEIYKSSFSYMLRIIKKDCEPIIVGVNLEVKDPLIITIISNSITLTPGTITIDADENKLLVLALKKCEESREIIAKDIKENFEDLFLKKG